MCRLKALEAKEKPRDLILGHAAFPAPEREKEIINSAHSAALTILSNAEGEWVVNT